MDEDFTVAGAHGKYAASRITSTPMGLNKQADINYSNENDQMDDITEIPRLSMGSNFQRKLRLVIQILTFLCQIFSLVGVLIWMRT